MEFLARALAIATLMGSSSSLFALESSLSLSSLDDDDDENKEASAVVRLVGVLGGFSLLSVLVAVAVLVPATWFRSSESSSSDDDSAEH